MQSTPSRLRSPACVSSDSRSLIETYAPLTGGSFKETLANAKKYAMLSESSLDEFSNRSAGREHKRSRTKLTVIGPPVAVTKINSYGQPEEPRFVHGSLKMLRGNGLYLMLIFVPIACMSETFHFSEAMVFFLSCLAILPLAGLLGEATEQVAFHTNETLGGLLNATFGNATELIVAYFALKKGLLEVVQVSLLGSILSNTLLVLGCSCLAVGIRQTQAKFNLVAAQANTTLLQIAILGLVVPTAMESTGQFAVHGEVDLILSRGISISLLVLYVLYVYFQLFTHAALFEDPRAAPEGSEQVQPAEEILLPFSGAMVWLAGATILIAYLSEALTGAIEGTTAQLGISDTFVGFVIIPIIGNAAEHSTAIAMAWKGKMDLAFGVALGSSTQIALFVIPVMVILGWIIDQPMDLYFGVYETVITFLSALIVSHVVGDGETNWLEGAMLLFTYFIICFAFFFYHHDPTRASPADTLTSARLLAEAIGK